MKLFSEVDFISHNEPFSLFLWLDTDFTSYIYLVNCYKQFRCYYCFFFRDRITFLQNVHSASAYERSVLSVEKCCSNKCPQKWEEKTHGLVHVRLAIIFLMIRWLPTIIQSLNFSIFGIFRIFHSTVSNITLPTWMNFTLPIEVLFLPLH